MLIFNSYVSKWWGKVFKYHKLQTSLYWCKNNTSCCPLLLLHKLFFMLKLAKLWKEFVSKSKASFSVKLLPMLKLGTILRSCSSESKWAKKLKFWRHPFLIMVHFAKNQANQGGSCISGVTVLQKLTLKLSDYGQSYLFSWIENFTKNRKCILTIT